MTVRTRFAPSPTGYLHIGGVWTALFSWMYARKHGGQFILRIEDTDTKRTVAGALENLMASLRWVDLEWDEGPDKGGEFGPYTQTERQPLYEKWAHWLVDNGHAYKCFATPAELEEMRRGLEAQGDRSGYDRRYRDLPADEVAQLEASGRPYVIRFKMPLDGQTTVPDLLRGDVVFDNKQFTDYVLLKSNGLPTYHLAHVVDDHFMEISHITRGVEWLNTAPIHVQLFQAFGWDLPVLAHLPVILNPSGKGKLSKRHHSFAEDGTQILVRADEFMEAGYLPEALINFLANIGWTFGNDREKFTMAEALPRFELKDISPAPTKMPYSKLDWLDNQYIQELPDEELVGRLKPYLDKAGLPIQEDALRVLAPAIKVRLKKLGDALEQLAFLTGSSPTEMSVEDVTHKKLGREAAAAAFTAAKTFLAELPAGEFTRDTVADTLRAIGEAHTENGKAGPFLGTARYVVTGQKVSPPLFESILALGQEETLNRFDQALKILAD